MLYIYIVSLLNENSDDHRVTRNDRYVQFETEKSN